MTIKVFKSSDYGSPVNSNAAGAVIGILDACLVNGYGSQAATLARVGQTVNVTVPVAHGLKSDTFVTIAGANQSEYNGEFKITVTGSNSYTYQCTGTPVTPATGTITAKISSAGWTKPFTGTNLAAYKQGMGSNGMYLRVADTTTAFARCKSFETMTDVSNGSGDFPTELQATGGLYIGKNASSAVQPWVVIASEKWFFYFAGHEANSPSFYQPLFFGDIISNKSGDAFNTALIAQTSASYGSTDFQSVTPSLSNLSGHYLARAHTQIGSSIPAGKTTNTALSNGGISQMGSSGVAYPSIFDGALHLAPVSMTEYNVGFRGTVPNLWCPLHSKPFNHLDVIDGSGQFLGKKFLAINMYSANQCLIDISNP